MTRRQREGKGGRDHHGCRQPGCPMCSNRRQHDGPTRDEHVAELEQREQTTDGQRILDRITGNDPELQAEIQAEVELCKLREAAHQHRRMAGVELRPRIVELSALKAGWMNGEGAAFDVDPYYVEQVARALEAAGMAPFWIYPTLEGGVQFEGDSWAHELVINP